MTLRYEMTLPTTRTPFLSYVRIRKFTAVNWGQHSTALTTRPRLFGQVHSSYLRSIKLRKTAREWRWRNFQRPFFRFRSRPFTFQVASTVEVLSLLSLQQKRKKAPIYFGPSGRMKTWERAIWSKIIWPKTYNLEKNNKSGNKPKLPENKQFQIDTVLATLRFIC